MIHRQRRATWFLYLACLVVLICMTQRMAGLHALQVAMGLPTAVVSGTSVNESLTRQSVVNLNEETLAPLPCELSSKSLLAASPLMFEHVLFGLCLLLVLLAAIAAVNLPSSSLRVISPSTLRIHLRLCVFRE